ncbi:MAG: prephenate dehydrogenase [Eubacterium coprostanoligenes]|uniref:prephenate dehydrogenase n=1 Tax=Eubacterium coprostanoligenes TaxID=290054 RepID=UPI00235648D6|nr:prephenate dehydrogenase [Eubacterium coprostanoligenes]MCI7265456.1 prephenate dehydrogenase [Eubacterium coprostanoligenes]
MNILICGLGLIGASLAKTLKKNTDHTVLGWNRTSSVTEKALRDGVIDRTGDIDSLMAEADITFINFYPEAIVPFILEHQNSFKKDSIVSDSCGIKTKICRALEKETLDFYFIGAHPMAGREVGGYDNSLDTLYDKASFIVTPVDGTPRNKIDALVGLAQGMGFARTVVTTPEHHDEMIAFTSQIAHVLACSYVLSPLAPSHAGYSAGSYRDVSRVARINADMWADLFIDNKEALVREIDDLVSNLMQFKYNIVNEDSPALKDLMNRANKIKEEIG